ncbi:hypothetical protein D9M71_775330 [compost metagenome]
MLERHRHFRSADQWQVQAVRVPGIGAGQTQRQALFTDPPGVAIKEEIDPVASFQVDMAVRVILL